MASHPSRSPILPGAEPFLFEAPGELACVLIHGFTGSASELRDLGQYLADQGITAQGLLLSGHGTTPEALIRVGYQEWIEQIELALDALLAQGKQVFLAGLSMGGTLALNVASRRHRDPGLAGIITMAAPLKLVDWRLSLLPLIGLIQRWQSWGRPDIWDERRWATHVAYDRFHLRSLRQLLGLLRETRQMIQRVHQPTLVVHSRGDLTVPPFNAELIMNAISSRDRRLIWLENCGHVVTVDFDSELVQQHVAAFILERSQACVSPTSPLFSQPAPLAP